MANRRDVELRIRARDLGTRSIDDLNAALDALSGKLKAQGAAAALAATSIKELEKQERDLAQVLTELSKRRDALNAIGEQRKVLASTAQEVGRLRKELVDLQNIRASGKFLGDIDKAIRTVEKSLTSTNNKLTKQTASFQRNLNTLSSAGLDVGNLAGELRKVETAFERTEQSIREASAQKGRYADAVREVTAVERQSAQDSARFSALIARQRQLEEDGIRRQNDLIRQQQAELERLAQKRRDVAVAVARDRVEQERNIKSGFGAFASREAEIRRIAEQEAATRRLGDAQARQRDIEVTALQEARRRREALTKLEQRLAAQGIQAANATNRLSGAFRQNGAAAGQAAAGLNRYNDSGRRSLSVIQRVRGQVLALASAYIGLYGAINFVRRAVEADISRQGLQLRLLVANSNDTRAAAADMQFLRDEAQRLGFSLNEVGGLFSKMAISAKQAGFTTSETREIFSNFAQTARVFKLGGEQINGVFFALEQILNKGKVQAEELRRQLGDRLPGAFAVFANATGRTTAELDKALRDGTVSARELIEFSKEYARITSGQLAPATRTLQAEFGRLQTAVEDFLVLVAESGLRDGLRDLAVELQAFLRSEEGVETAKRLGTAFLDIAQAAGILVTNLDKLQTVLFIVVGYFGAKSLFAIFSWAKAIRTAGAAAAGSTIAVRGLTIAVRSLLGPLGLLLGLSLDWFLTYRSNVEQAQRRTEAFNDVLKQLETASGDAKDSIEQFGRELLEQSRNELDEAVRNYEDAVKRLADAQRIADQRRKGISGLDPRSTFTSDREVALAKRAVDDLREQRDALQKEVDERERRLRERGVEVLSRAEQMQRVEKVSKDLSALELEINDEKNLKRLKQDEKYFAETIRRFEQFGKDLKAVSGNILPDELRNRLDAARQRVLTAATPDVVDEKAAEKAAKKRAQVEKQLADAIIDVRRSILDADKENLTNQLALIDIEIDQRIAKLRELQAEAKKVGLDTSGLDASIRDLEVLRQINQEEAKRAYIEETRNRMQKETQDAFQKSEEALNRLLATRQAKLDLIQTRRELGLITEREAVKQANEVELSSKQAILDKVAELQAFILNNRADLSEFLNIDETLLNLQRVVDEVSTVQTKAQQLTAQFQEDFAAGAADAFGQLGKGIAGFLTGVGSLSDAFKGAADSFLNFVADFLVGIGEMIIQQLILNALQRSGAFGGLGSFVSAAFHTGGVVGRPAPMTRTVNPMVFAAAQRFHTGGFPGLRADEVPIIAQRGEEVLSRDDPRNALNGGASPASGQTQQIKIVNAIDSASVVQEGLNSPAGTRAILNFISANRRAIKSTLA